MLKGALNYCVLFAENILQRLFSATHNSIIYRIETTETTEQIVITISVVVNLKYIITPFFFLFCLILTSGERPLAHCRHESRLFQMKRPHSTVILL